MRLVFATAVALLLLLGPERAFAAEQAEERPVGGFTWMVGGGMSAPIVDSSKRFTLGGEFTLGIGYRLFDRLMVQIDYLYGIHGIKADILKGGNFGATHTLQAGNLSVFVTLLPRTAPVELYVLAGSGIYGRTVEISTITGGPVPSTCDPELLLCTAAAPFGSTLAKATKIGFGVEGGVGASVSLGVPVRLFLEVRFHYIWNTVEGPSGLTTSNGQYIPVTLGFRYF
ncbi:MAG TPA: hypothetical protein VGK67_41010 [Myxococcales bacterium]